MVEGIVRIYMSYVEPEDKNLLWLRPFLKKEGYELLYYGSKGWTPLCPNCHHEEFIPVEPPKEDETPDEEDVPCGCFD